jgi:multisubunit Na+/H+ antiporter MnhE subunit
LIFWPNDRCNSCKLRTSRKCRLPLFPWVNLNCQWEYRLHLCHLSWFYWQFDLWLLFGFYWSSFIFYFQSFYFCLSYLPDKTAFLSLTLYLKYCLISSNLNITLATLHDLTVIHKCFFYYYTRLTKLNCYAVTIFQFVIWSRSWKMHFLPTLE